MKYDFDTIHDRKKSDSAKWGALKPMFGSEDVIPMWVADMDFPSPQPVVEALKKRAEHPFYGYAMSGKSVTESVVERMERKFNWRIKPEWVVFTPGVVPALNAAIRAVTHPGDGIILQEPIYYPFFSAVKASGCHIDNNGLKLTNGRYEMDYDDLRTKFLPQMGMGASARRNKALVLCNPHNPVGRLWSKEEITRMGEIVIGNGGIVISDEIHCEILMGGRKHTPFASVSEEFAQNSIVCMAPSKTFSLAGLETSTIIIPNKKLREEFNTIRTGILPGPNLFGMVALEAAYRHGDEWLEQVLDYIGKNLEFLKKYLETKVPKIKLIELQGTYLAWLDCRVLNLDDQGLRRFFREKAKVGFDDGYVFGEGGSGFQRMNIACPRTLLEEALSRIEKAVNTLQG
jgi:cystathionine beta-lyase